MATGVGAFCLLMLFLLMVNTVHCLPEAEADLLPYGHPVYWIPLGNAFKMTMKRLTFTAALQIEKTLSTLERANVTAKAIGKATEETTHAPIHLNTPHHDYNEKTDCLSCASINLMCFNENSRAIQSRPSFF